MKLTIDPDVVRNHRYTTVDEVDVDVASVVALLLGSAEPGVTYLAFGETSRHRGYESETQYLLASRPAQPMRLRHASDRNSHRRWLSEVTTVREVLENLNRGWQGQNACRRQAARAYAAQAWYGVPNIVLGA